MTRTSSRPGKLRTIVAAIGAAAVLVAGAGVAAEAAGSAKSVLLGKNNKAKKTTKITNKKAKPALALKTKSGPALSVNTSDLIANLNADLLDGKSAEVLSPAAQTFSIGTAGATGTGVSQYFQTTSLPAGTYEFFMGGAVQSAAGDTSACTILDATRYIASGATDTSAIFVYDLIGDSVDSEIGALTGHFIGQVVAGNRLMFACQYDTATTVIQPTQFTIRKIDGSTTIPGVGATTLPRGARPLN